MESSLKKTKVKLDLSTDIDMLLMVEKGIKGGICNDIHQYVKANNRHMKDHDKNKEPSYLKYWDVNNLCEWAMSQNLPVNGSNWGENTSQFDEDFAKSYNEDSNERHFLEVHFQHPEEFHELHNDLPFSSERMKIKKVEKVVANLHDKKEYVTHIRNSKQALNHGLVLKKVHRIIKFNQKAWLKPNIDMNTELRKKS